jgi:hypothetical protein
MNDDKLRLICRCGMIYDVADLPMDVNNLVAIINDAECPTCHEGSQTACIYMGNTDDLTSPINTQD